MNDRRDLWAMLELPWPLVPPAIGAFVGLRYADKANKSDRVIAWIASAALGIYLGPALGEHLALGPKTTVGVSFLIAMLGTELFAVLSAALRQMSADPAGTFRRWIDAWLGRGP